MDFSSDIFINASVLFVSLHVVTFNQTFDSLLDLLRIWRELDAQYLGTLSYQTVMVNSLATLHYLDYGCIDYVLSVVFNLGTQIVSFSLLLSLGVHDGYLNLDQRVMVSHVHHESVLHFEFFTGWILQKDLTLTKWYQVRFELVVSELKCLH